MKILNWFRRKPQITITSEVVVSPRKPPRTDLPEFSVEEPEGIVNLWPFACEVLATYPKKVPISPEALARLCVMGHNGKYIKVGLYPQDMDRAEVKMLMGRTITYARWPDRFAKMMRTASSFPATELRIGQTCCARARQISKHPVSTEELERLPLDGCWEPLCQCWWRPMTARQLRTKT